MNFSIIENRGSKLTLLLDEPVDCLKYGEIEVKATFECGKVVQFDNVGRGFREYSEFWIDSKYFLFDRFVEIELKFNGEKVSRSIDQKYNNYQNLNNFCTKEEINSFNFKLPEKIKRGSTNLVFKSPFGYIKKEQRRRTVVFLSYGHGQGDVLLFEPTLRKLSQSLNKKLSVVAKRPESLFNHPCVEDLFLLDMPAIDYCNSNENIFIKEENFDVLICRPNTNLPFRWSAYGHTERAANFLGFNLRSHEKSMKIFPVKEQDFSFLKEYVVCSINISSPLRFWSFDKWNNLFRLLQKEKIKIAVIGTPELPAFSMEDRKEKFIPNHTEELDLSNVLDLTNKSMETNYNIINSCKALVTTDTVNMHVCGCTDAWLFLIGSHINPEVIMPWRNSSQSYKAVHISGECDIFCGSDISYSMTPNKVFSEDVVDASHYCMVDKECLEGFDRPICHPEPEKVFKEILKIYK